MVLGAADSQQQVPRAATTCGDGSVGCGYYVDFQYSVAPLLARWIEKPRQPWLSFWRGTA